MAAPEEPPAPPAPPVPDTLDTLPALDALGPSGTFRARNRITLTDVAGRPAATLGLVPRLYVRRTMAALRAASPPPAAERFALLARAGRIFAEDTIGGLDPAAHERITARVSGVPLGVVRAAAAAVTEAAEQAAYILDQARPAGAADSWRDPRTRRGSAVWTRRGSVFAVHAAGNHPGPHSLWLEALALGYRVAVRPSRREPFTPYRLVAALRAAGFGPDQVALLPTGHEVADTVLDEADLGLVYGGDEVVAKYGGSRVLPQGPGRSKILVTAGQDWRDHLDVIVDSVAHQGGVACINATTVLVEGDPGPLSRALAERLAASADLPPEDPKAVLPVQPAGHARALEAYLLTRAAEPGARAWLGGDGIVSELGDGSAVLRPAVHQLERSDDPRTGLEMPFPCVWVAPWSRAQGIAPLRGSLVVSVLGPDADTGPLVDELLAEPTVSNVYTGSRPTYWIRPGVPHDGFLSEFLMRTKTAARD
ncbi:aldehyde dehydrogenase family protein [Streptomyces sp. NBC_01244]|uniref:aldehyde dehydrogenase family protein n=1 Tax=Streptomyces sp. NBC_01244 TaxID=2903797 RepID=UPI002E128F8E|nr:acyl-CoA reductase [Streptomyces sp. NBC_01244]